MPDPRREYSSDNPFAQSGSSDTSGDYSPDNPFAPKKKPGLIRRALDRISSIGSDDEVSDPATGYTTRRSATISSSRPKNDRPGNIDLSEPKRSKPKPTRRPKKDEPMSRMQEIAMEAAGDPSPRTPGEPGVVGSAVLRGAGSSIEMLGAAAQTATGNTIGETPRKIGRAVRESAQPKRVATRHDIHGVGDALTYGVETAVEGGMSTVPIMAAGAVGGPIAAGGVAFAFAAGETRMELEQMGITDEATIRKVTAVVAPAVGLLDTAVPMSVVRNIIRSSVRRQAIALGLKGTVKVVGKSLGKTMLFEGVTEGAQQVITSAGSRKMTGKPIDWRQVLDQATEATIGGILVGGVMGGAEARAVASQPRADYDADAAALGLGVNSRPPAFHPDTPPEVAQRIAQSANAKQEAAARASAEPERITGAAIQVKGNTYTGGIHADAVRTAIEAGDLPAELLNAGEMDATHLDHGAIDGFVTDKGRFVDRVEAERIAEAQDQIRHDRVPDPDVKGELDAIDLKTDAVEPPKVGEMRTMDIFANPARFQFKAGKDEKTGAGGALKKVDLYREDLAGIMTVWRDPADSKVYVVNGHHRLDLAKRSGAPTVLVRFITAPNEEAARVQGAIQNIAEGQGTPTDVAKFLRDTHQTLEDLKAQGVPVEGTLAEKGIGLSRLAPDLFQKVATGKIEEATGVGIGTVTADPDMQRAAASVIQKSGKRLTEKEAADVTRQIVAEGSENITQETLFGTEQETVPLYVEKAQLAGAIQRRLENDKRLFSYVTKGSRADELARAGNTINKEKSAELAEQSAQLGEVFRQLFTRKGAVSDALTEGARRLAHGEKPAGVADSIYEGIRQEIQTAFGGGKGEDVSGNESDIGGHAEEGGAPDEEVTPPDPNQDALFDAGEALPDQKPQRIFGKSGGYDDRSPESGGVRSKGVGEAAPRRLGAESSVQSGSKVREGEGLPWHELVARQRQRLYDKLARAQGKDARQAVIRELRELDKVKNQDPAKGVSADEMGARARNGETKEAIDAIAGEEVVRTSTDRAQSDIFTEESPIADDVALEDNEQGSLLSPAEDAASSIEEGPASTGTRDDAVSDEDLDPGLLDGYDADLKPHESPFAAATPAVQAVRAKIGLPPLPRPPRALIDISRDLADQAGVPLRQGRFNAAMRQAAGVFFPHSETARVTRYDKVGTVAHEIGHFASKKHLRNPANKGAAGRGAMVLTKGMLKELRQMGKNLYGSRKPAAGYGEEGIAESFKFYVTDPPRLTAEAPEFSLALEAQIRTVPILHRALLQAREDFAAHNANSATARADALISVDESVRNMPTVDEIVRQTVDDLHPFRKAVEAIGGTDDITKHAYVLGRLTRGDAGLSEEMNERGVIDFTTRKRVTKGLIPVLQSIPKEKLQAFRRYLLAERALELHDRNIDIGLTHADATAIQKMYQGEFRKQAEEMWAHSNALLKYRRDAGLLTDAEHRAIQARNARRVPMYVVFDEEKDNTTGGGWGKKWGRNTSGIHTIRGSARRKIDPLEGLIQDTYQTVEQANRHHVAATLFKLGLETEGAGKVIEEVARPKEKAEVNMTRVLDQLVDLGIVDPSKLVQNSRGGIAIENEDGSTVDLDGLVLSQWNFREQQNAQDQKDMVIPVVIDGERHWLQIQDPKLFDAVNALGHERLPGWARLLGAPARALRAGATLTPEFIGRNPFRDLFTIAMNTRSTNPVDAVPGVIFAKGLFHFLQKDDVFQRWRLEGGDQAAQLAIDRKEIQNHIEHVTRNWHEIARDIVIHPIDVLRLVSAAMENSTRVGEFSVVEKSWAKTGKTPRQASIAGALASRDGTLDFGRHGAAAKSINQIVAFFNAQIQGTAKTLQEHRRRPGTMLARGFFGISLPSLILFAMQHDDPDYKKLPRWRRSLFWNYVKRDKDGNLEHIFSFPKPFEYGIIYATGAEAIAEWWLEHDATGFKEWARAAAQGFTPNMLPTGLMPLIENWANKSFYTGRKIVPAAAERRGSAEQSRESTGDFARMIGERVNYSPAKIENLVRGFWGGLGGNYALPVVNAITRADRKMQGKEPYKRRNPAAEDRLTEIPFVKGFTARPPTGTDTQQVEDLYDAYQSADAARQSYKALKESGRDKDAHSFAIEHRDELASVRTADSPKGAGRLREAYNRLQKVRERRSEILRDDKLSASEKKRRVRILDDRMVKIAERGLAAVK
ncbi:MAG: hypothetical protein M3P26_10565 [Gemmatimonadota bacterium]|nr:hypothetical protein [Gemmatimonadota bacterium]